jgi:hypothetical protein
MPDRFRHYEGVPVLDLPADPPSPTTPALEVLNGASGETSAGDGPTFLSQLLLYSAAISSTKRAPSTGDRYPLRVNPSSGNLHPTEFHFLTRGLKDWTDGLYHYRPSAHMAEQRALGGPQIKLGGSSSPIVLVLTTIAWREAWKYRDRAYRYCLHDIGHAMPGKDSRSLPKPSDATGLRSVTSRMTKSRSSFASTTMSGRCSLSNSVVGPFQYANQTLRRPFGTTDGQISSRKK